MSVEADHPDAAVLAVMAKGAHGALCNCGDYPCQRYGFMRVETKHVARGVLSELLAAGYDWTRTTPVAR